MAQMSIQTQLTIEDDTGRRYMYPFGRTFVDMAEIKQPTQIIIGTDSQETIYDYTTDSSEQLDGFTVLVLVTMNGTLDVEFTANEGHTDEELCTHRLVTGVPFVLGSDASYYNHAANNATAGTLDVTNKIRVRNLDASNTVTLMMAMGK